MTKRSADAWWRCAEVNSPGFITCTPVYSRPAAALHSLRPGLTSITTRRAALSAETSCGARRTKRSTRCHFHKVGTDFGCGYHGSISLATVHSAPSASPSRLR
jgi:hypothetical protein